MFTELFGIAVPLQSSGGGVGGSLISLVAIIVALVTLAGQWKTFKKAGKPGWAAIIPIYNFYVMLKIGNNKWWWILIILFIPLVNLYGLYKMMAGVSRAFGHGIGFALGLWFLSFIFWPILGFGDEHYQGPPGQTMPQ